MSMKPLKLVNKAVSLFAIKKLYLLDLVLPQVSKLSKCRKVGYGLSSQMLWMPHTLDNVLLPAAEIPDIKNNDRHQV